MTKNIKIQYSTRYNNRKYHSVPKIQMEGKWLEELGFSIGDIVAVEYENGCIPDPSSHLRRTKQKTARRTKIGYPQKICCIEILTVTSRYRFFQTLLGSRIRQPLFRRFFRQRVSDLHSLVRVFHHGR